MTDAPPFQVGDLVTRDGSDVHRVVEADDGWGVITVVCVTAPFAGWIKVGETESNLARRYEYARTIEGSVAAGAIPAPFFTFFAAAFELVAIVTDLP